MDEMFSYVFLLYCAVLLVWNSEYAGCGTKLPRSCRNLGIKLLGCCILILKMAASKHKSQFIWRYLNTGRSVDQLII